MAQPGVNSGQCKSFSHLEVSNRSMEFVYHSALSQSSQSSSFHILKRMMSRFCRPHLPYRFAPPPNAANMQQHVTQPGASGRCKSVSHLEVDRRSIEGFFYHTADFTVQSVSSFHYPL